MTCSPRSAKIAACPARHSFDAPATTNSWSTGSPKRRPAYRPHRNLERTGRGDHGNAHDHRTRQTALATYRHSGQCSVRGTMASAPIEFLFVVKGAFERGSVVVSIVSRSLEFYARCGSGS